MLLTVDSNVSLISETVASFLKGNQKFFKIRQWCASDNQCIFMKNEMTPRKSKLMIESPIVNADSMDIYGIFSDVTVNLSLLYFEVGYECQKSPRTVRMEQNYLYLAQKFPNHRFLVIYGNPQNSMCAYPKQNSERISQPKNITYYITKTHNTDEAVVAKYILSILGSYFKLQRPPTCADIRNYYIDNKNDLEGSFDSLNIFDDIVDHKQVFSPPPYLCDMYDFITYPAPFRQQRNQQQQQQRSQYTQQQQQQRQCDNRDCVFFK